MSDPPFDPPPPLQDVMKRVRPTKPQISSRFMFFPPWIRFFVGTL